MVVKGSVHPLAGLVAVELGSSVGGPTCAQILAELGVDVIKIENPKGGDDARAWGPPFVGDSGALFTAVNRNKRSAAIDLKDKSQLEALRAFILDRADIVLQNLRAGVVESYMLDGPTLIKAKPSLIYCSLAAFGDTGPHADKPGYDPLMQAFGGLMSVTGEEGRPPVRVGPALIDQGSALWMVIGILAQLHQRERTGNGGLINSSLYETALWWMNQHISTYFASNKVPGRLGTENGSLTPYKAYEASDGWVVIAAANNNQFARLAAALGHREWAGDSQYKTNPLRVKNRVVLNALVAAIVKTRPRDHWLETFDKAGVPCAPILRSMKCWRTRSAMQSTWCRKRQTADYRSSVCLSSLPVSDRPSGTARRNSEMPPT
jgi:crotonobetainyl-CoA:carnitine CoA-transferase CaiB-like acyl-CoA transferase